MLHENLINIKQFKSSALLLAAGVLVFGLSLFYSPDDTSEFHNAKLMVKMPEVGSEQASDSGFSHLVDISVDVLAGEKTKETDKESSEAKIHFGLAEVENALLLAKLDSFGRLVIDTEAEASLNRVVARLPSGLNTTELAHIQALIKLSLPGEAGEQVADVLSKYYRYKEMEASLILGSESPGSMQAALVQLEMMAELRQQIMGAEYAESLFGLQQRKAEYYLEKGIIEQDASISIQVRNRQLALLDADAQKNGLALNPVSEEVQQLNAEVSNMRTEGLDEALIQARREQTLGKGASDQLSLMEAQQNDWQLRYQSFEQEKNLLLASALDDYELQQQMDSLFLLHYSVEELPGARAYDKQFAY